MIPVSRPLLDGNEKDYLIECVETGWISSEGPFVARLERFFEDHCGRRHGVAVCNGSAALDLALSALDLKAGDEVILPSFTIISCIQAVMRTGAVPVVVDCEPTCWTMAIGEIEAAVTRRTKAIMAVHIYGLPCDMDAIAAIADRHDLWVVEDAAEAHGLDYKGRPCGAFGDVATFSFYSNKIVTTGEGGMVLTDDSAIAARLRARRNLCFEAGRRFVHEDLGWNMRMSNMQAAIGCAQTERLAAMVARKKEIGRRYQDLLRDVPGLRLPPASTDHAENVYWVFGIVLDHDVPFDAKDCMARLAQSGVAARPFFWPLHEQPVLRRMGLFEGVRLPVCERIARCGLYIPSGPAISDEDQTVVADALTRILRAA